MASEDPYFEVKGCVPVLPHSLAHTAHPLTLARSEVEAGLRSLSSLAAALARHDRASPDPQQRDYTLAEIRATLTTIEPDLDELDEAVVSLEEPGVARRLGVADYEVRARRDFVQRAKGEVAVRPVFPSSCSPRRPTPVEGLELTASCSPPRSLSTGNASLPRPPPTRPRTRRPTRQHTMETITTTRTPTSRCSTRRSVHAVRLVPRGFTADGPSPRRSSWSSRTAPSPTSRARSGSCASRHTSWAARSSSRTSAFTFPSDSRSSPAVHD